jgi:hypothetical protein
MPLLGECPAPASKNEKKPSSNDKQYKSRINSEQKQKTRIQDLKARELEKAVHKAATIMYDRERKKESGLSVRKVAEEIKSQHNGVGPSPSTIHGLLPQKQGHSGNIPLTAYKALCTAVCSKMRICQLNKTSSMRKDQIEWLMTILDYDKKQAAKLWERVS